MPSITIRNLDDGLKSRLRVQAARHGHSMENEAREILRTVLSRKESKSGNLAAAIRARFAPLGGVDLPKEARQAMRRPIEFEP
jgi:antitoxin FitA